jgi:hypothetical protein
MAGQNRIIDVHSLLGFSKAEDRCDLCEGSTAQTGRSPYLGARGPLSSPRANGKGETKVKDHAEDYVMYWLVYVILASVAIVVVAVVGVVFLL